ncbi:ATPase, T2SS/T4P/T4SS family [Ruegeria atlantica]|uniref:ATPase, T2SS/T4P/T4SS family n=1 Tax=Ruegeria atlantica TaxID=81569 RepID=UPI0014819C29|nr:ATPase, T2SS/T4P/T4SS family [Ruegeria atlantica]
MSGRNGNSLLEYFTGKIEHLLHDESLSEISVNPDGSVWVEEIGTTHMNRTDITLNRDDVENIGRCVAGFSDVTFGEKKPIATANVPTQQGKARVQVVIPPATTGIGSVAIRLLRVKTVDLGAFSFASKEAALAESNDHSALENARAALAAGTMSFDELADFAMLSKWNVIIAGGTSSGKTTVLNAMLKRVDPGERIVTIEEVAELDIEQPNSVDLLADRSEEDGTRSPTKLLESALRLRPDRLICGEIRGEDANMFLELVNTGHDGSVCTMHANSPVDAIGRMSKMVRRGSPTVQKSEVVEDIRATIHMIVHMKKIGDERKVNGVIFPPLMSAEQLI